MSNPSLPSQLAKESPIRDEVCVFSDFTVWSTDTDTRRHTDTDNNFKECQKLGTRLIWGVSCAS
jgi:hypothetical protein